ncbi:hypothetical protein IC63_16960 [Paracoccus sphaerophysae]|uniref:Uncharacterized protein n=2 Tax=Paracoccus sphaerophysae TaxID=690417 RepID=A0A099EU66_9RHOB|nr:hypothetical protein IC63_16960 [Paracoccus sphaerophysae]
MKRTAIALSLGLAAGLPAVALAQAGHDTHHPAQTQEQAAAPAAPTMPMPGMPDQMRTMMQAMPAECMSAMQQMMQGGMMHGAVDASKAAGMAPADGNVPDFTRAYVDAMDAMHGPMMDGVMADDPDTAFVRGMIRHHQGAIDMARIVQQHGDDPQTKAWAEQIIAAQEREIAEMEAWLKEKGSPEAIDFGQTGGTVWSADEGGSSISAIGLGTGTVTTTPIPVAPHNVDLTPDGRFLLAVGTPASGDHGSEGHGHDGDAAGLLVMLDPQDLSKPAVTVEVGAHPAHVVADTQGRAYASLSGADEVAVVDLANASVVERIQTGAYPHGLRLSPDGTELYVANVEDGSVSVIDTANLTEAARIPVGTAPVQVGFTPDGSRIYVSLRDENRVAVIDTATREVTGRIEVGPNPIQMIATPDGRQVYVANQGTEAAPNDTVSVIDTATGKVAKTLKTAPGAHGVSVSADGAFVFVTNIADDSVSVIDVARQEVVGSVPVGDRPNGIVYGPSN